MSTKLSFTVDVDAADGVLPGYVGPAARAYGAEMIEIGRMRSFRAGAGQGEDILTLGLTLGAGSGDDFLEDLRNTGVRNSFEAIISTTIRSCPTAPDPDSSLNQDVQVAKTDQDY